MPMVQTAYNCGVSAVAVLFCSSSSLSWRRCRFSWSFTTEFPQLQYIDKVVDVCCVGPALLECRRGGDSRAPTVQLVVFWTRCCIPVVWWSMTWFRMRGRLFGALYTGTGPGVVSTGTRPPQLAARRNAPGQTRRCLNHLNHHHQSFWWNPQHADRFRSACDVAAP